ncbi:MAG TPA: iron ABC transporter permease [Drouetiella sp.]
MGSILSRFLLLTIILVTAIVVNVCVGDVTVPPQEALQAIIGAAPQSSLTEILWQIRLPRICVAVIVGAALATSGYLLQALSRNSLADPYLTGVSSGAGLAVALATVCNLSFSAIPVAAFIGGLGASALVAFMARSPAGFSVGKLLLSGVGLSAICGAFITMILIHASSVAQGQGLFFWLAGGIAGHTWSEVIPSCIYTVLGILVAFAMSKQIRLLSLGPQSAQALGLDVAKTQWILLGAAVLMCGSAVSVSGLVGFVGLIAPHLSRRMFGQDERIQIICAAMMGMTLVLVSDLAARTLGQGQELPLGTLLSLIGGPFFLWLISSKHNKEVLQN